MKVLAFLILYKFYCLVVFFLTMKIFITIFKATDGLNSLNRMYFLWKNLKILYESTCLCDLYVVECFCTTIYIFIPLVALFMLILHLLHVIKYSEFEQLVNAVSDPLEFSFRNLWVLGFRDYF